MSFSKEEEIDVVRDDDGDDDDVDDDDVDDDDVDDDGFGFSYECDCGGDLSLDFVLVLGDGGDPSLGFGFGFGFDCGCAINNPDGCRVDKLGSLSTGTTSRKSNEFILLTPGIVVSRSCKGMEIVSDRCFIL
ncbi:hypothetical protein ACHAP3_011131 [Botrytis cinerea]